ncbi:MAG: hypothetical protein WCP16_18265 [Pseudanabaena sp. ELA645]|jgi:hypothetical protein
MDAIANLNITEADRLIYASQINDCFEKAVQSVGEVEYFLQIADFSICLKFAGNALIDYVIPALAHLKTAVRDRPDLTICLWDRTSTHTDLPANISDLANLIKTDLSENFDVDILPEKISANDVGKSIRSSFDFGLGIINVLNLQSNQAYCWFEDVVRIPYWYKCSPLQFVLNIWMDARQYQYVHAGAIGYADGGVLLVGKGGSGKSSTSLTCLNSPLLYAGDDYCLMTTEPQPYVYSLYNSAKLKGKADLERFPHLANMITNGDRLDTEKAILFLNDHYPDQVWRGFPIKAVLVPKVTGARDTTYHPISAALALRALAPSTIYQLRSSKQMALSRMSALVQQVLCYRLDLGTDMGQIPLVIARILEKQKS